MSERHVYLDRIEEGIAVLLAEGDHAEEHIPISQLPKGVREGEWLLRVAEGERLKFRIDPAKTTAAKREVQSLMDELSQ